MLEAAHAGMYYAMGVLLLWAAAFSIGIYVVPLVGTGGGATNSAPSSGPKRAQKDAQKNPPVGATGDVTWNYLHDQTSGKGKFERAVPEAERPPGKKFKCRLVGATDKNLGSGQVAVYVDPTPPHPNPAAEGAVAPACPHATRPSHACSFVHMHACAGTW